MGRALLIGSPVGALEGTATDLELMADLLVSHGFSHSTLFGPRATRANILEQCEILINSTPHNTPVVLYFSGHGGLGANPHYRKNGSVTEAGSPFLPFLVPFDIGLSTQYDFRGILELELNQILERLSEKSINVTMIFDCCHAAGMSRKGNLRPKAITPWTMGLDAHLEKVTPDGRICATGDRRQGRVVRVFATTADCQAFEYESKQHGRVSLFTEVLCNILKSDRAARLNWHSVMSHAREQVLFRVASQRPEAAGPVQRFVFEAKEHGTETAFRFLYDSSRPGMQPALRGGHLQGLEVGDVFGLYQAGAGTERKILGRVRITAFLGDISRVEMLGRNGEALSPNDGPRLPPGLDAVLLERGAKRLAVHIRQPTRELRNALRQSPLLCEQAEAGPVLATVHCEDRHYTIVDEDGQPLTAATADPAQTVRFLEQLARAQQMLNLQSGTGDSELQGAFRIAWGIIAEGRPKPFPNAGARLHVGDTLYIELDNLSSEVRYLHVFSIDLDRRIYLLTRTTPSGVLVFGGEQRMLGWNPATGKGLWRLGWGESPFLDPACDYDEHLVAIISDQPVDLLSLEAGGKRGSEASLLVQKLQQICQGNSRSATQTHLHYEVRHFHFRVCATMRLQEVAT